MARSSVVTTRYFRERTSRLYRRCLSAVNVGPATCLTKPSSRQNESMQLTDDMQRIVREQALSASSPRSGLTGTPALSPKGTTSVWDAGHLMFLHLHSPHTVDNLRRNAAAILAAHSSASWREGTSTTVTPPMASGTGRRRADEIEQLMTAAERYVRQITGLTVDRLVVVPGRIDNVVPR